MLALPLILASSSPRRQELLRNAGIEFAVEAAAVAESRRDDESAIEFAERMATEKARAIFQRQPTRFVLGADTVVVVQDEVLGKPRDAEDAARMLRLLSGRSHQVTTGVCLMGPAAPVIPELETNDLKLAATFADTRSETTRVTVNAIGGAEISEYIANGEPMDKAGAYAIQGIASRWISRIEGCYLNVVGLPVPLVFRMLREHGALPAAG